MKYVLVSGGMSSLVPEGSLISSLVGVISGVGKGIIGLSNNDRCTVVVDL